MQKYFNPICRNIVVHNMLHMVDQPVTICYEVGQNEIQVKMILT